MKAKTIAPNPPVRSIADILTEANSLIDLDAIIALWIEIMNNKYSYFLDELHFAREQFKTLTLRSNGSDKEKREFIHGDKPPMIIINLPT